MTTEPWIDFAGCNSIGVDAFFIGRNEDWDQLRRVCAQRCTVRLQCLDFAMRMEVGEGRNTRFGMFGGLTPAQRKKYEAEWLAGQEGDAA